MIVIFGRIASILVFLGFEEDGLFTNGVPVNLIYNIGYQLYDNLFYGLFQIMERANLYTST